MSRFYLNFGDSFSHISCVGAPLKHWQVLISQCLWVLDAVQRGGAATHQEDRRST
jgi:hypothetical protein